MYINCTDSGNPHQWVYSATAEFTAEVTSVVTSTSNNPSDTAWLYSPVYSSTQGSARCYEQIFTEQSPDPMPNTPDYTNFITSFSAGFWDEVSYTGFARTENQYGFDTLPLFRAYHTDSAFSDMSAHIPVDGVKPSAWLNTSTDGTYYYGEADTKNLMTSAYRADGWIPVSYVAGSYGGELLGAFACFPRLYSATYGSSTWEAGLLKELPEGAFMSGCMQLRRSATGYVTSTATAISSYTAVTATSEHFLGMEV